MNLHDTILWTLTSAGALQAVTAAVMVAVEARKAGL